MQIATNFFRLLILFVLLTCTSALLTGCVPGLKFGFVKQNELENVQIEILPNDKVNNKVEFLLRNKLAYYASNRKSVDNMVVHDPRYKLIVKYDTYEDTYAIQTNTIATRQKAGLKVWYELSEIATNKVVSVGHVNRSGSFNVEDSTYSTYTAKTQEFENLVQPVVEEMLLNITMDLH